MMCGQTDVKTDREAGKQAGKQAGRYKDAGNHYTWLLSESLGKSRK